MKNVKKERYEDSLTLRRFSYEQGDREIDFTVGRPACKNKATINRIEEEEKDGVNYIFIYVKDKFNNYTLWKKIIMTLTKISVIEYDWTKVIE